VRVATDDAIRGVLLRAEGRCFSAGLDLREVMALDRAGMDGFFSRFDRTFGTIFRCPKPMAVAVQGHAIAGGLVLALAADYVAWGTGDYTLALTELDIGVPFPRTAIEIVRWATTPRAMRRLVYDCARIGPAEAYEWGLGDAIAEDPTADARAWLERSIARPLPAFKITKARLRGPHWERIDAQPEDESGRLLDALFSEETRNAMSG
jgi:enoyl-CoA hydratase